MFIYVTYRKPSLDPNGCGEQHSAPCANIYSVDKCALLGIGPNTVMT